MDKVDIDRFFDGMAIVPGQFDHAWFPCAFSAQPYFGDVAIDCFGKYYPIHAFFKS